MPSTWRVPSDTRSIFHNWSNPNSAIGSVSVLSHVFLHLRWLYDLKVRVLHHTNEGCKRGSFSYFAPITTQPQLHSTDRSNLETGEITACTPSHTLYTWWVYLTLWPHVLPHCMSPHFCMPHPISRLTGWGSWYLIWLPQGSEMETGSCDNDELRVSYKLHCS